MFRGWFRPQLGWSGGEARLFVVNPHLARWHPTQFLDGFLSLFTRPLLPAGFRATIDTAAGPWPRPG